MNNCTTGHDAHTFCPDENCAYHKAVAEVETEKFEKLKNHKFDTTEYVKISAVNPQIDSLKSTISDLIEKNNEAQAEIARLKAKLEKCKEQRNEKVAILADLHNLECTKFFRELDKELDSIE